MEYFGLIGGVTLLIWLALRGINIVFASLLSSALVIITNGLPVAQGLTEYYSFGSLGAFTFAGKFFLLFVAGAVFGRFMGESNAASSIALMLVEKMGKERVLLISIIASALLTYGGVVVFVVIFAMYPLGLKLLQEADVPKRLFAAAIALGAGTFTLTALPGTPSIHNIISSVSLGTDLFAGGWYGIVGSVIMLGGGIWYLEQQRLIAKNSGEGFKPSETDRISSAKPGDADHPKWQLAVLPLAAVILTILLPRAISMALGTDSAQSEGLVNDLLRFAKTQPLVWPSLALFIGSLLSIMLFPSVRGNSALILAGNGTQDAIMPLINTAAVIGFGGVVTHTTGFSQFTQLMTDTSLPPLLSMFSSVSIVSAITGSASGGLQIFMQTMAQDYLAMGIAPEVLHRVATMASGGFDSLPHCGAVVAMLTVMGLTHKQAYKDIAVITVVFPVIATLVVIGIASVL